MRDDGRLANASRIKCCPARGPPGDSVSSTIKGSVILVMEPANTNRNAYVPDRKRLRTWLIEGCLAS